MATLQAQYEAKLKIPELAAGSLFGPQVLLGGTGTGKSRTLAMRAHALLGHRIRPDEISFLTCGNTSAEPLTEQLVAAGVEESRLRRLFVGNIHDLACFFLREGGAEALGLTRFFTVWTWEQAADAMGPVWCAEGHDGLSGSGIRSYIDWDCVNRRIGDDRPNPAPHKDAFELRDIYRREKIRRSVLDPQDLIDHSIAALKKDPDLRDEWRQSRTKHILADHFEDITNTQYELMMLLTGQAKSIMVATDPNQSEGERKGAYPTAHERLVYNFPNHRVHSLDVQRRSFSLPSLVSFNLPSEMKIPGFHFRPETFQSTELASGDTPRLLEVHGSAHDMDNRLLDDVQRAAEQRPWETMAILHPRQATLERLTTKLLARDIPHHRVAEAGEQLEAASNPVTGLLGLVLNPKDLNGFAVAAGAAMRGRRRRLPTRLLADIRAASARLGSDLVQAARGVNAGMTGRPRPVRELAFVVHAYEELVQRAGYPETGLDDLWGHAEGLVRQVQGEMPDLEPGTGKVREFLEQTPRLPDERLRDHLARFLDLLSPALHPPSRTGPGIALCSFTDAKGREWDQVWLADVADHIIPGTDNAHGLLQACRNFYVAASRAREEMDFYLTADRGRGYDTQPSRILVAVDKLVKHSVVGPWEPALEELR